MSPTREEVRDRFAEMRNEMTAPSVVANLAACRRTVGEGTAWLDRNVVFNWENDWSEIQDEYDSGIDQEEGDFPERCPDCEKRVEHGWSYCPNCAAELGCEQIPFERIVEEERKYAEMCYRTDCVKELEKVLNREAVSA